jgi:hypothetical protein
VCRERGGGVVAIIPVVVAGTGTATEDVATVAGPAPNQVLDRSRKGEAIDG